MFRRNHRDAERDAHIIENLKAQETSLYAQLVAQSKEAERRLAEVEDERDAWHAKAIGYDEMKRDRDYWREQAEGGKL